MSISHTDQQPWYKQFWPWFIIALPATVVVAGLTTVYIAFTNADSLVSDNYYKDGLAINQVLAQDQRAAELAMSAHMAFDRVSGEVLIEMSGGGAFPPSLQVRLLHPLDDKRDQVLAASQISAGRYRADLKQQPEQRYYLELAPAVAPEWRLKGEIDFRKHQAITLDTSQG